MPASSGPHAPQYPAREAGLRAPPPSHSVAVTTESGKPCKTGSFACEQNQRKLLTDLVLPHSIATRPCSRAFAIAEICTFHAGDEHSPARFRLEESNPPRLDMCSSGECDWGTWSDATILMDCGRLPHSGRILCREHPYIIAKSLPATKMVRRPPGGLPQSTLDLVSGSRREVRMKPSRSVLVSLLRSLSVQLHDWMTVFRREGSRVPARVWFYAPSPPHNRRRRRRR